MRILTWNIRSGGAIDFNNPQIENIHNILRVIDSLQADIIVLQEFQFKYYEIMVQDGLEKMGYEWTVCKEDKEKDSRYRVLIGTKYSFDECEYPNSIRKYSRRNWNEIILRDKKMAILGVDVPLAETKDKHGRKIDNRKEKQQFLEALKAKFEEYANYDYPAIILGDFNLHEKAEYKEYLQIYEQHLTEVTTEASTCGKYKFDYIFVNSKMLDLIDKTKEFKPHYTAYSDHKYLYLDVDEL